VAYLRYRKSIKLGPGVRMNFNKRSVGMTIGGRGAHFSVNTSGRTQTTSGIPGTGLSLVSVHHNDAHDRRADHSRAPAGGLAETDPTDDEPVGPVLAPDRPILAVKLPSRPSLFASAVEKEFVKGVQAYVKGDAKATLAHFATAVSHDVKGEHIWPHWSSAMIWIGATAYGQAIPHLEAVAGSDMDPDRRSAVGVYDDRAGAGHAAADLRSDAAVAELCPRSA
jgi:hypothetical protein